MDPCFGDLESTPPREEDLPAKDWLSRFDVSSFKTFCRSLAASSLLSWTGFSVCRDLMLCIACCGELLLDRIRSKLWTALRNGVNATVSSRTTAHLQVLDDAQLGIFPAADSREPGGVETPSHGIKRDAKAVRIFLYRRHRRAGRSPVW